MYTPLCVHIKGISPQIMSNGQMVDVLNRFSKKLKEYTSKRKKTDEDYIAMMEWEFKGSLYCFRDDDDGPPYWPAENIHACLKDAAKERKLGKTFDKAVLVEPPGGQVIYDGPRTREGLWNDERFRLVKKVVRQRASIISCRPIFNKWEMKFNLNVLEEKVNKEDVVSVIRDAGRFVGLSTWRPRYGLFELTAVEEKHGKLNFGV